MRENSGGPGGGKGEREKERRIPETRQPGEGGSGLEEIQELGELRQSACLRTATYGEATPQPGKKKVWIGRRVGFKRETPTRDLFPLCCESKSAVILSIGTDLVDGGMRGRECTFLNGIGVLLFIKLQIKVTLRQIIKSVTDGSFGEVSYWP